MPRPTPITLNDLRGTARLATDATLGVTAVVEAMHARIAGVVPWSMSGAGTGTGSGASGTGTGAGSGAAPERTRRLTGLVYGSVRGITRLAGSGADTLLALAGALRPTASASAAGRLADSMASTSGAEPPHPGREAALAVLNGVLGDHLADTGNPLAVTMALRHRGQPLRLERQALAQALPQAGPRLLVLLHGLCMNDLQWQREGHDHGAMLARDAGWTPVYLHYNSGLPIARNGRLLAALLQDLLAAWPQPLQRVALLGHSMGGLLARSALHHGQQAGHDWPQRVQDLVMLGSPHHGAPLERAGHGLDRLLAALPYASPLSRLGQVRSAGITDLRHGRVHDDDAAGVLPLPGGVVGGLPAGLRMHAVAAQLGEAEAPGETALGPLRRGTAGPPWRHRVLNAALGHGDGLVPRDSALGVHADPARSLPIAPERQAVVHGIGHLALLSDPAVAARLRQWLA